jgi:hypothetical protein
MIKDLDFYTLINHVTDTCNQISIAYGLKNPDSDFIKHLTNTFKKYYGHLEIEQIDDSFTANSLGLLNTYLGKSGMSIDNKVKFTISDITKIINAYLRFKKINEPDKEKTDLLFDKKDEIRNAWCNYVGEIFDLYMNEMRRTPITIPVYYCEVLAGLGLLDKSKIDYSGKRIVVKFSNDKYARKQDNENLIYKCFDELLDKGEVIQTYLTRLMPNEMPY